MNMKNYHLKLQVKDDWKYTLIARLVDREDFIEDILAIRKHLKLKCISRKLFDKEFKSSLEWTDNLHKILFYVNNVIEKYTKSINYQGVIFQAVCTGVIKDEDIKLSKPYIWLGNDSYLKKSIIWNLPQETSLFICIDPETDRNKIIKEVNAYIRKQKKVNSNFMFIFPDVIDNIREARMWYWQVQEGKDYKQLAEKYREEKGIKSDEGESNLEDRIKQAVYRYKQSLSKYTKKKNNIIVTADYQNNEGSSLTRLV